MKNIIAEIYEFKEGIPRKKITSFLWVNPDIKIKLIEKEGRLEVFYQNVKKLGSYCKVYANKSGAHKFYLDGYNDNAGAFKYARSDL